MFWRLKSTRPWTQTILQLVYRFVLFTVSLLIRIVISFFRLSNIALTLLLTYNILLALASSTSTFLVYSGSCKQIRQHYKSPLEMELVSHFPHAI